MNAKATVVAGQMLAFCALSLAAPLAHGEDEGGPVTADFGADLRVRQEIMKNVPGLPGGGNLQRAAAGPYRNHMRFRPRVWGELDFAESMRIYMRLTDEFRWNVRPKNHSTTFPDEVIIDNLYIDATGLVDGLLDFRIGRQDIYGLYGLDRVFVDGTPGDGSRTVYSDVARATLNFSDFFDSDAERKLDVFALHNWDDNPLRWGTTRGHHRTLSGLGGGADPEMDDWGWGAVWSGRESDRSVRWLPYQFFFMQKRTEAFHRNGVKHPATRRELFGARLMPEINDELSLEFEGMGQIGRNSDGDWLSGWSSYAGVKWKSSAEGDVKPFANAGLHFMSGDKNAANEDGGRHAWDPMWARGVNDSELFLYGTHYGIAWWSNMILLKFQGGVELGRNHKVCAVAAPMFAATDDGLGGDDGHFKGLLSQLRYDFPLLTADKSKGERFEVLGHVYAELFNPGDYFETDKPAWFLRWQVEFRF